VDGLRSRLALLLDDPLVFVMQTNPNPYEIDLILNCKSTVVRPDPGRLKLANLFKVQ